MGGAWTKNLKKSMEKLATVFPEVVYIVYIVLAKYSLGVISWLLASVG